MFAPVRGARIVLVDDDGTRANMTASWLAQMAWQVFVLDAQEGSVFSELGPWKPQLPSIPQIPEMAVISYARLNDWLSGEESSQVAVLDFAPGAQYARRHIPGSWFALRSQLTDALKARPEATKFILTSSDGVAARFAWPEAKGLTRRDVFVLDGGTNAWASAGLQTDDTQPRYASPRIDRYARPYEGIGAPHDRIQAYLDWEFGLVEQLDRDGTHGFRVI